MRATSWRTGLCAVLGYLFLSPAEASAKIMLITSGDTVAVLGKIAPEFAGKIPVNGVEVGYLYSYGGIFWIDFWTWGGEYCIKTGENSATVITPEVAAMLLGQSNPPSRPFLYKFPLGLLILGGLAVLGILGAAFGKKETAEKADPEDVAGLDQYRKGRE